MDRSTLIGLLVGWGALTGAVIWEGGPGALRAFWNGPAFLLVAGGTLGATILSFPIERIRQLRAVVRKAFVAEDVDTGRIVRTLVGFADRARRDGLLSLEEDMRREPDPFLKKGIRLAIDGTDPEIVRDILETELAQLEARHREGANLLLSMGGFAPTLGVIGTVAGLVFMLLEMSDQESMGRKISGAFIATLYGVSFANLLFLPLGSKLKRRSEAEVLRREMMIEGILAVQSGDNPRLVEQKLTAFLPPSERPSARQAPK
uniref:Flagellar motor rotation protein MotA n=1 Tax=uncultured Armatimonadetes bacterium TaxID=157466 RepID=A0A6J4J6B8_9BACT|nr:Flagellar motor rotation protein MotA [uncultured Armatimonadetes bacterium]